MRGFYWRGINRDHDATDDISGYGGEAQFKLNAGSGITPFLITGAGRIDYDRNFRDSQGRTRQDQTALILGGGASITLSERVHLNVAVRDFITTSDDDLEATRSPDELLHNRLLSAGLSFAIGGQSRDAERRRERERRADDRAREFESMRAENDSLMDKRRAERRQMRGRIGDPMLVPPPYARQIPGDTTRYIVIPVPTMGEIIIRYGAIGASPTARDTMPARPDDTAQARRDTSMTTASTNTDTSNVTEQLMAMERRLTQHLDRRLDSLERSGTSMRDRARETPATTRVDTVRVGEVARPAYGAGFIGRLAQVSPSNLSVLAGYGHGDGSQLVLDARADLGPLSPGSRFSLVPELSLGLGGDRTTVLGVANLRYDLLTLGAFRPYVLGGAGFFSRTLLGVVTSVGASTDLRAGGGGSPLYGFVELQGINLFDRTRVLVGLSSRR